MIIKVKEFSHLNGRHFTTEVVREYIKLNNLKELEVTPHNMNFYKIAGTEFLIHVYDTTEVR